MKRAIKKLSIKLLASIIILFAFMYITILINFIPPHFSVKYIDGDWVATYPIKSIFSNTNELFNKFIIFNIDFEYKFKSINTYVFDLLNKSLKLLGISIVVGLIAGIAKGVFDSRRGERKNNSLRILATIIPISIPDILMISLLQLLAVFLSKNGIKLLKVGGAGTINHLILPITALSILPAFYIARTMTMSIESCYQKDYIKAARGKGCSNRRILWNHVFRNAIGVVFETLSNITALIICNLMIIEYLFAYPGLTTVLMRFFRENYKIGIIYIALVLGLIFFMLDLLFYILKNITYKRIREDAL